MKLVVDIPDDVYDDIQHNKGEYISTLNWAVRNGMPYNPSGDTISREALKKDISEKLCDKFDKWNKTITVSEFEAVAVDAIDNAPTVIVADRWIPVTERLPKTPVNVLVQLSTDYITTGHCVNKSIWTVNDRPKGTETVTHWRPLPNPCESEDKFDDDWKDNMYCTRG